MIVALVVAGVLGVALWSYFRAGAELNAGACIRVDETGEKGLPTSVHRVSCEGEDVYGQIIGEMDVGERESCVEEPGAIAAVDVADPDHRTLCVGEIGADPDATINTVEAGDCVVTEGERPRIAGCDDPGAMQVIGVLEAPPGVPEFFGADTEACVDAGHETAESLLTWGLEDPVSGSPVAPLRGACLVDVGADDAGGN